MKPDWLAYVRPCKQKIDLVTCEVKPPGRQTYGHQSDFVKLGLEMRSMLNAMIDVISKEDALAFGILVEGKLLQGECKAIV